MDFFHNNFVFNYIILPIIIFCSRILDVSIGTVRIILINRGFKFIAPILGFFEVLIWLIIISQVLNNLNNVIGFIAFSAGFATGNLVGMVIEEKLAFGYNIIRIITNKDQEKIILNLVESGFGVTRLKAEGSTGPVNIIFTVVRRKDLKKAIDIIQNCSKNSFYTIEDVRYSNKGVFPNKFNQKKLI